MRKGPLTTLFITIFIDLLGFGILIPILPVFSKELAAGHALPFNAEPDVIAGWVAASFSLMQFVFAPVWGSLSDRIGRRPIILGSILATALGYLLLTGLQSIGMLFMARIVAGIGSANISAAQAYIADITAPHERAKRMGLIGAAFGLGFVFGPPLGGYLYEQGGMNFIAWVTAALCLVNFGMAWFTLPESLDPSKRTHHIRRNPFSGMVANFRMPISGELFGINFVFIVAFSMMQTNASLLWKEHFGLNQAAIGNLFGFIGISSALVQSLLIGYFSRQLGEKKMLLTGICLVAIGLVAIPFPSETWFYTLTAILLLLIVFGNSMTMPALNALLSVHTPADRQGHVLGAMQSTGALARGIGPILAGYLYSMHFTYPYLGSGLLMVITIYLAIRLIRGTLAEYISLHKQHSQGTGS
jgi:MFS transporter, DHA1 family, tetracycline resistance protein